MVAAEESEKLRYMLKAVNDLQEAWLKEIQRGDGSLSMREVRRKRRKSPVRPMQWTTQLGLAAHAVTLSHVVVELVSSGKAVESIPTLRFMFELGLTNQWIEVVGKDAANAMQADYIRQQKLLRKDMAQSEDEAIRSAADFVTDADAAQWKSASLAQARRIDQKIGDLHSASDLYVFYRDMSSFSHPNLLTVSLYFNRPRHAGESADFSVIPQQASVVSRAFYLLLSLCWALEPVSGRMTDPDLKELVRAIANDYKIPLDLRKSDACRERLQRAKKRRH